MTRREFIARIYPEVVKGYEEEGAKGCPHYYKETCLNRSDRVCKYDSDISCSACWEMHFTPTPQSSFNIIQKQKMREVKDS